MNTKNNLRNFVDYRQFLNTHVAEMKSQNPEWSIGNWAQRMGLRDTSSITKILNGTREPGELITERLVAYFNFSDKDKLYFEDMIRLKKVSKDLRLSAVLMEKMGVEALESQSFTVQADKLAEAKNLIAEFRNKFAEVFNHEHAETYYQIQIQVLSMQGRDLSVAENLTVS